MEVTVYVEGVVAFEGAVEGPFCGGTGEGGEEGC